MKGSGLPIEVRLAVFDKYDWTCRYCNLQMTYHAGERIAFERHRRMQAAVVDHFVPKSRGGSDHPSNLVCACFACNSSKGRYLYDEWMMARCAKVDSEETRL